ncbi:hypothetical protein [Desulfotruncus alcoholivorax]|uniref:hypothetical protein n=1 Tax=Desulfotruncus alcoholivorax TaxID=265477 RepID=UPI000412303D|nr:hypothetical protein [Desulfotruncus alcoholivorax]
MKAKLQVIKPVASTRPGPAKCFVETMDKLVTRVQEWLESPPDHWEEKTAYVILALAAGYILVRLCAFLI